MSELYEDLLGSDCCKCQSGKLISHFTDNNKVQCSNLECKVELDRFIKNSPACINNNTSLLLS